MDDEDEGGGSSVQPGSDEGEEDRDEGLAGGMRKLEAVEEEREV